MDEVKTNFAVLNKYEAFYTGGKIQVSKDGKNMFCGCGNRVQLLDIEKGSVAQSFGETEDEEITVFVVSPDDQFLVLATRNILLRQWNWKEKLLVRSWKGMHVTPISCMTFDPTSTLLVTGSSDSTIKIWDVIQKFCTHNLRGHQGVVSVVKFHPDVSRLQLFSAAEDYKVRVWDLQSSRCIAAVEAHVSLVTDFAFSLDGNCMFSCGRDSVVAVWNTQDITLEKCIPVFENVESLIFLPEKREFSQLNVKTEDLHFITAGNKGILRVWNARSGKCVFSQKKADGDLPDQNITQAFYIESADCIAVVTYHHLISLFDIADFHTIKQFSGFNDEVLDVQYFGKDAAHLAVATNCEDIKVFELNSWNCQILKGHSEAVLSLSTSCSRDILASSSKDNTVRLWMLDADAGKIRCVAVGLGHTLAVNTIAINRKSFSFLVSGGEDFTLKIWEAPPAFNKLDRPPYSLHAKITERAHEKTINSVCIAPNDKFIATGSGDKTVKLWDKKLRLLGTMKGHRKGIWCVNFSPVDQCIVSASGDGTIKIWTLTDFSCVKTFEGHDSSVLKVLFLNQGRQLLSSGSDGLMKLWFIKSNECIRTFDEHQNKTWALTCDSQQHHLVSGGADSTIIVWKDITETELIEAQAKKEDFILREQKLMNLIHTRDYVKAIQLAITLDQPFRMLTIMKEILKEPDGKLKLEKILGGLQQDQIGPVLSCAAEWNKNKCHCHEAQLVVAALLNFYPPEHLLSIADVRHSLESLIAYSERHYERMTRLLQQASFLQYTEACSSRH